VGVCKIFGGLEIIILFTKALDWSK